MEYFTSLTSRACKVLLLALGLAVLTADGQGESWTCNLAQVTPRKELSLSNLKLPSCRGR